MVLEIAELTIEPGAEAEFERAFEQARTLVARAKGFQGLELWRVIEHPSSYRLLIRWDSVEDQMVGFRESELFDRWAALLRPHYAQPTVVVHGSQIAAT